MSIGVYGILVIFGLFVLLLIINPNLSCFGKRIKSPFYPLTRKKRIKAGSIEGGKPEDGKSDEAKKKARDYGFHLH
jgi:hypothetical protein